MPSYYRTQRPQPRRRKKSPYGLKRWRGIRARFLAANPVCPCGQLATEVDHIDGDNTNNVLSNFQQYCKACHARKGCEHDGLLGRPKT